MSGGGALLDAALQLPEPERRALAMRLIGSLSAELEPPARTLHAASGTEATRPSRPRKEVGHRVGWTLPHVEVEMRGVPDAPSPEELLRDREHVLYAIVANSPAVLYAKDLSGRYLLANPNLEALLELPQEEILGKTDEDLFPGEIARVFREHDHDVAAARTRISVEESFPRRDGELRTFLSHRFPVLDRDGRVHLVCGISLDVTESKRAEAALVERELAFRTLANSIPQLAWMTDAVGWAFWYNRRWYEYTGAPRAEMRGWGWRKVHHPEHVERVVARLEASIASGEPFEDTFPLRRYDGEWRWFLARALPVRDEHGAVSRWFGTATDVTDHMRTQEALAATQQRLALALEQAELGVRMRDEFISIASHELKTPITSMRLQAQLTSRKLRFAGDEPIEPALLRRLADTWTKQLDRLTRLVEDMLDISRITTGKLAVRLEEVDVVALVSEVVERTRDQASAVGCAIRLEEPASRPRASWDRFRIEQVVTNLLSNAMKYGAGKPIEVSVEAASDEGVEIRVRDHGVGIASKDQQRIFAKYERAADSNASSGLGLGLYISASIVELHGGAMRVESAPGQGACFLVRLPVAPAVRQAAQVADGP